MNKDTVIKIIISVGALVLFIVRLTWPDLKIDAIAIGLFVVCILPWASVFVESLKAPGGWEVKLREYIDKVNVVIDASSESTLDTIDTSNDSTPNTTTPTAPYRIDLSAKEQNVLEALTKARVPLRSVYGIRKDTGLSSMEVQRSLDTLDDKGLATKVEGKKGLRWAITPDGRTYLEPL